MTSRLVHDVAEFLATLPLSEETIRDRPGATIVPPAPAPSGTGRRALSLLERLARTTRSREAELSPGRTLGEGGMAVVRLARQVALGRDVAVKELKEDRPSESATMELLREAWVTGALEHPNVVPVYDIDVDSSGSPQILLKRIEGIEWSALISDPDKVRERFGAEDLLEWNLGIFRQVCNALRFAHSRGIVHRDVKPDNVMIGEFGEVYLLDWGIAVSLVDDGTGRLPLVKDATFMAGTPAYMAPEMLGGGHGRLSERTDVYLLGGLLYHLLVGEPPHRGESAMEIIRSVLESKPELPVESTPPALAVICRKAMSADPQDRFASVDEVQKEVADFLEHRGSALLGLRAERKLEQLLERLESGGDAEQRRQDLYLLFGQCRFGFREALSAWPENRDAQSGLRRAAEAMAEYELGQGHPRAAALLLDELGADASSELVGRARRAAQESEERNRRLTALERSLDPAVGRRTRFLLGVVLGLLWTVTPAVDALFKPFEPSHGRLILFNLFLVGFASALGLWARESLSKSWQGRRAAAATFSVLAATTVLLTGTWIAGLDVPTSETLMLGVWFAVAAQFAMSVDRRLLPAAAGYMVAFFVACAWPASRLYAMSASNLILTVSLALMWRARATSSPSS